MPSYRHHNFGNLYIQFDVKFPTHLGGEDGSPLTPEDIAALERILPPRISETPLPENAMTEDYNLEEIDQTREAARARGVAEEDDDDMHPGGERVQCASQ